MRSALRSTTDASMDAQEISAATTTDTLAVSHLPLESVCRVGRFQSARQICRLGSVSALHSHVLLFCTEYTESVLPEPSCYRHVCAAERCLSSWPVRRSVAPACVPSASAAAVTATTQAASPKAAAAATKALGASGPPLLPPRYATPSQTYRSKRSDGWHHDPHAQHAPGMDLAFM